MRTLALGAIAAFAAAYLVSCSQDVHETPRQGDKPTQKLLDISRTYLRLHHPDWVEETYRLPCMILDEGDYWEVRFRLPENMVGGTPVIHIEKGSLRVIKAFHEQ